MSNSIYIKPESNYDIFKRNALKRFLTFNHNKIISRLNLDADDDYIYITFFKKLYRIGIQNPVMDYQNPNDNSWYEADCNAVMTICDLLCHSEEPIVLSGELSTLQGLSTLKSSSTSSTLGDGLFGQREQFINDHIKEMAVACEAMGGVPVGKGDLAYSLPLFGDIRLQFSFYEADDEFPATLTFFLDSYICKFMHYESLWYMIGLVLQDLTDYINKQY